jgi:PAS domain S-box-containing protein
LPAWNLFAAWGVVALSGLLAGTFLVFDRERDLDQGQRLTDSFAAVVDQQTSRGLQALDQRLELVAAHLEQRGPSQPPAAGMLDAQLRKLPLVDHLRVLDDQGQVHGTAGAAAASVGPDDADVLQIYRTRPGAGFVLQPPRQTGDPPRWVLTASRPVLGADGRFAGAIVATVQADYFNAAWRSLARESGSAVSLLRTDGTLMMRSPMGPAAPQRGYADGPLFTEYLPVARNGSFRRTSPIDGASRLAAYRTLEHYPDLVVVVGRATDVVLAQWRQRAALVGGGWLLGSLALVAATLRLRRLSAQRRHAERSTLALAQRMSIASEAAGIVVWDWDPRQPFWHATPTQYTLLGYPPQDGPVQRERWLQLVHADDLRVVQTALDKLHHAGESQYRYEIRLRHADGSYRWVQTVGRVHARDANGRPTRIIGVRMDITERKRAEHERQQMLERITDGFVALDREWRFVYVNRQAGELLGRDPAAMLGKSIWSELPPLPNEQFPALCRQAMAEQKPMRIEAHYPDLGLWIEDHVYPSPEGMTIYFRDITQRKADELALRQAKEHAENLIAHANVMIVGLDVRGAITLFNRAAQDLTGYTLADLAGRNWFDVLCPRQRYPQVWEEFERLAHEGPARQFENPILTRSGTERTIAWQNTVLRDGATITGTLSFGIDVTARCRIERELAESRDQFETLALNSMQGIALVRKGQLSYVNPALCALVGRSAAELTRLPLAQLMHWIHPDDREDSRERQRRALRGEHVPGPTELRIQHADGDWRWVQSSLRTISLRGETVILGMLVDIHDRKTAEMELHASEDRLRATLDALPDLMFEVDLQGRYLGYHSPRTELLVTPPERFLGHRVTDIMPADAADVVMAGLHEAMACGHSSGRQLAVALPDGPHWFELSIARKAAVPGAQARFVVLSRDVSDRIRTQQALRDSEELMRQMAESVSQVFWLFDMQLGRFLYISPAADAVLGCPASELAEHPRQWRRHLHPDDLARFGGELDAARTTGRYDLQLRLLHPDGHLRWIHARAYPIYGQGPTPYRCAGVVEDITARKTLEIREQREHELLQFLASGHPMHEVLAQFVLAYEAMVPGMLGSVLLLDADGTRLRHGAAPHLPQAYRDAIDGLGIGPAAGSCGTAAHTGATVVVADIADDPRWADYRALAEQHGLRACWSVPIVGMRGQVLGTFAFYFRQPRDATPDERATIERGARLASQAVERLLAQRALQDSEERYRTLVEWSPEAIVVHQDGCISYVNPAAATVLGAASTGQLIGLPVLDLVHPDDRAQAADAIRRLLSEHKPTPLSERRIVRLDGTVIDVETKHGPIVVDGVPAVQLLIRDVTARKQAEAELRDSRQQLRVLSAKVLAAQETERRRIAHELHDELGQALTAIKINLLAEDPIHPGTRSAPMAENIRIVEQALQQVRGLALALRPSMLDDLGLVPALGWLAEQITQRGDLQVRLQVPAQLGRLAPDLETAVFRIVQEALTNIVRHAQARHAQVDIDLPTRGVLRVCIHDDGVGFDVAAMRARAIEGASIGVLGMQERAALAGGALSITSEPAQGCTVTLHCPVPT